jgi:hypothetical protein
MYPTIFKLHFLTTPHATHSIPSFDPSYQAAADLAAYLSKGRGNLRTVVSVCSPKHLKRPSGPKVNGAVLMGQEEEAAYGVPENGAKLLEQHSAEEAGVDFG